MCKEGRREQSGQTSRDEPVWSGCHATTEQSAYPSREVQGAATRGSDGGCGTLLIIETSGSRAP
jgi:hypothetical protein